MLNCQIKIILASSSPQRAEILKNAGIEFEVKTSHYIEENFENLDPKQLTLVHAYEKAKAVADHEKEGIIIGCDTIVVVDGIILFKPRNINEARQMITKQQGKTFDVISGFALFDLYQSREFQDTEVTRVTFNPMTDDEIDWYVAQNEWRDKSGGFAVQGLGSRFIKSFEGDFLNVVGLPVQKIYQVLRDWGYAKSI